MPHSVRNSSYNVECYGEYDHDQGLDNPSKEKQSCYGPEQSQEADSQESSGGVNEAAASAGASVGILFVCYYVKV